MSLLRLVISCCCRHLQSIPLQTLIRLRHHLSLEWLDNSAEAMWKPFIFPSVITAKSRNQASYTVHTLHKISYIWWQNINQRKISLGRCCRIVLWRHYPLTERCIWWQLFTEACSNWTIASFHLFNLSCCFASNSLLTASQTAKATISVTIKLNSFIYWN